MSNLEALAHAVGVLEEPTPELVMPTREDWVWGSITFALGYALIVMVSLL